MPVKLFECFSFGLPVVVTDCTEMARFVEQAGVGLVAKDNAESLSRQIQAMLSDPSLYQGFATVVRNTVEQGHQWVNRARKAVEILTGHQHVLS
jgi:glycosyltransferase involved in cell wall biosynthesis